MKRSASLATLTGISLILTLASAIPTFAASLPIMPLSDVKPGMKGVARTVAKGTQVSEFNVEVLDVVNAQDLARGMENVILVKASGDLINQTGGIAEGMSGSPVIIDGKVVGAISLSMGIFTDATIGGVTPIEEMLDVDTTPTAVSTSTVGIKPITIAGQTFSRLRIAPTFAAASEQGQTRPGTLTLSPPQIPLCCTGITRRQIKDKLGSDLSKYNMKLVPGSNLSAQPTPPLEPGSSIGVGLVTGDVNLGAIGTLTYLDGNRFWAFGHPLFFWGDTDLPLTGSTISTVVPSLVSSFKFGSLLNTVGSLKQDRGTAVAGVIGEIPITVSESSTARDIDRGRLVTLHTHIASDDRLLQQFAWIPLVEAQDRTLDQAVRGTARVKFKIEAEGLPKPFVRDNMFFDENDIAQSSFLELMDAITMLATNQFKKVTISTITVEADVTRTRKAIHIDSVKVLDKKPAAGTVVKVEITYTPWTEENRFNGNRQTMVIPFRLPGALPPGPATIIAHTGTPATSGPPKTLPALVEQFEERPQNNELVLEAMPGIQPGIPLLPSASSSSIPGIHVDASGKIIMDFIVDGEASAPVTIQRGSSFLDVPAGHWASGAIVQLAGSKIASGYPNGTFHPEAVISRQELAVLLAKTANLSPIDTAQKHFADVSPHNWSSGYINSVVKAGYLDGAGATLFDPQGKATRAQVIKAIISASPLKSRVEDISQQEASSILSRFSDTTYVPEWARKHLAVAVEKGLVGGYPTGELRPNVAITRAEAAKLLVQGLIETN